jgi:NADPH2:quinone reductase
MDSVRAAGANHVVDRNSENVRDSVLSYTGGIGVAAVFDPIGALTYDVSLQLLAPRGCLINYGELSGPVPAIDVHRLFPASAFVTKYNGMRWVSGVQEFGSLISDALSLAAKRPAVISEVAGRFPLDRVADAYRLLESGAHGKVLVLPNL